ncbi:MAG: PrsW family intramembrane metalloprotease, partial [Chloroflexi bacterium]|nr:PrsW family intramembrane metalloprotease [Chloroflexota bacterium]
AALSISSSYGMMFILLFEMIVIALVIAGVLLYLSTQPQIRQWMDSFSLPQNLSQLDIHLIERYARTLLRTPIFLVIVFLLVGLVLPLIEEILKPIAIWTLHRRSISPAEGFILGLYFGAAFALVESGGMIIQLGMGSWVTSTLLRAATGLLHITCSGLVGYAYARFMQLERKISAAIPLLIAVALHGTWNTVAVLSSLGSLSAEIGMSGFFSPIWDHVFSALMVLLWLTAFSILWKMNKKLQKDLSLLSHNENNDPGVHTFELE